MSVTLSEAAAAPVLQEVGPLEYDGTHIVFRIDDIGPKTNKWFVNAKSFGCLGRIQWFGRWRRYCFFPEAYCVFEEACLREIAFFIESRTKEHRAAAKVAKLSLKDKAV